MTVYTTHFRKVGDSIMVTIPDAMLEQLGLKADDSVSMHVEEDCLVIEPMSKPRYALGELMAATGPSLPLSAEEQEWLASPPVGRELL